MGCREIFAKYTDLKFIDSVLRKKLINFCENMSNLESTIRFQYFEIY